MSLKITTALDGATLQLAGDLDLYHVEAARSALLRHLSDNSSLILNLGGVETCDTAGLQLLLSARLTAKASGKGFSIQTQAPAIEACTKHLGLGTTF